mgnify:CR=1 FL=1
MKCPKFSLIATFSLLLALCFHASAQSPLIQRSYDDKDKTTAKLTALFSKVPPSGYLAVRLEVTNATKNPKQWSIECTSSTVPNHYYRGDTNSVVESEFSYTCPAKSKKTFDFYVPVNTTITNSSSYDISSNVSFVMTTAGAKDYGDLSTVQRLDMHAVGLSNTLYTEHASNLDSLMTSSSSGWSSHTPSFASSFDPAMLPSDWKAYVGYDSLVCTDREWLSMNKAVQNAILEWNRLGGKLIILRLNGASNFKSLDIDSTATGTLVKRSFGSVQLRTISTINSSNIPNLIKNAVDFPSANKPRTNSLLNSYDTGSWDLIKTMGMAFNPIFLILILIVFGIVVGPVNLFYFAKAGQRHRLFITTPIIAIAASLILVAIIIIQDGFGGYGSRVQLVEVRADNGENKAYIMQEQIARTGIVLGDSFETSVPTYITPVPLEESRFSRVTKRNEGGSATYVANHGDTGLKASGDWFQSRSLHGHYLESVIATRSRITLKSTSGAPQLNSSFEYPISAILYKDMSGSYWISGTINPGETVTLKPSSPTDALHFITVEHSRMASRMKHQLGLLWQRNGHFVAITQEAPAIDTLDDIEWNNTYTVITGPVVK